jgi:hypothetical protein
VFTHLLILVSREEAPRERHPPLRRLLLLWEAEREKEIREREGGR